MHLKKKNWDMTDIMSQISSLTRECQSIYNDGFTAFELKKDLHEIKFFIDQAVANSPTFHGEEEWLTEQEKKRIIKILKS
jgi:hypothetical protein